MAGNSGKTATGKPFGAGQSGNPSGRPKVPKEIVATCRELTPEVVEFWVERMRDTTAKDADRLRASENIFDRAYGKAMQSVDVRSEIKQVDVSKLTQAQMDALTDLAIGNMEDDGR